MQQYLIAFLILLPFASALLLAFAKNNTFRKVVVYLSTVLVIGGSVLFAVDWFTGGQTTTFFTQTHIIDYAMIVVEVFLMCLITYLAFKHRKYYAAILSWIQTIPIVWLELSGNMPEREVAHIYVDRLAVIMCLIVGIVGTLITVYAVGYMNDYHHHHTDVKDRRTFFFPMLYVFIGAMFGLVLSSNLIWIYFFWEITSVVSFLLIGYTKTEEAINNSFRALWMNLLGGVGFAAAIFLCVFRLETVDIHELIDLAIVMNAFDLSTFAIIAPVALLAFAGLTKSAQLPFSKWLLGAMVAPTPTSALLHSATMVKAGVYLLLRLAPALSGNVGGTMVTLIGGLTFFIASCLAITQSDGKKVLAYSTISNLGLITACAGIGTTETVWAGLFLVIFHAVSKSLLFQTVGAVENAIGSRDIEDMHGLFAREPLLASFMVTGIAGMFLAPFGMLIAKWEALQAFVDSGNVLTVIFVVFGSATTMFYWTRWLNKILSIYGGAHHRKKTTSPGQIVSLAVHAALMVLICLVFPIISEKLVEPMVASMFNLSSVEGMIDMATMIVMVVMLAAIFIIPMIATMISEKTKTRSDKSYIAGVNTGDNASFTDSFGNSKSMYLSSWYMEDVFGEKKLWKPSVIIAVAVIVVCISIAVGGAL